MPITPQGWPYMNGSDLVYQTPDYTQHLAAVLAATVGQGTPLPTDPPLDTGWVDLESFLLQDRTGTFRARAWNGAVEFRIAVTTEYSGNSTDIAADIPTQFRPAWTMFGAGYIAGRVATMFVRSNGSVAVTVADSETLSSSAQGTIRFGL